MYKNNDFEKKNNNVNVLVQHSETCPWHIYTCKMLIKDFGPRWYPNKQLKSNTFTFYFGYWYISFTHYR